MRAAKIEEISSKDKDFPKILKRIENCPERLYFQGKWDVSLFKNSLAIVGSRKMTRYGREVVAKFMPELVAEKVCIISGFMYGVDSEAHRQCVELGGRTVAVLGWGLNYEAGDRKLYKDILATGGLIISEYEADLKPALWTFPQRNRIVAGLASLGALVVQAGEKSGSLITARLAKEQKKKVWAVPGPIDSSVAIGVNWLIQKGLAKMATSASDILGREDVAVQKSLFDGSLDKTEQKIVDILQREAMGVDELARELGLTVVELLGKISLLSMKSIVEEENGKVYVRKT